MSMRDPSHTPRLSDYVETSGGPAQQSSHKKALVFTCGHMCLHHVTGLKTEVEPVPGAVTDGKTVFVRAAHLAGPMSARLNR
jgi:hypothetical protein